MALLSNLPLITIGNCVLCMWLWGGGILGAWLYPRFDLEQAPMTAGRGAIIGVVSGVIGAIQGTLLAAVFSGASVKAFNAVADQWMIQKYKKCCVLLVILALSLLSYWSSTYHLSTLFFGALGGAIGGMILGRRSAPPAPPAPMV